MAKSLDTLYEEYEEARKEFKKDRSDEAKKDEYKSKKKAFADARVAQRQEEEADPDHPRGQSMVTVADDTNGEGE